MSQITVGDVFRQLEQHTPVAECFDQGLPLAGGACRCGRGLLRAFG
jgi:DNA-binding IscR family transcriptional regulator